MPQYPTHPTQQPPQQASNRPLPAPPGHPLPPGYGVAFQDAYAPGPPAPRPPMYAPMPMTPYPYAPAPQNYGPYGMPYRQNATAVVSLICGLLGLVPFWIGFLLCIVAIICGILGIQQAQQLYGRGRGMAIAGLILGLIFLIPAGCGL